MDRRETHNEVLAHIGFWLLFLLLPFLKSVTRQTEYNIYSELNDFVFGLLAFYISYFVFSYRQKKTWLFLGLGSIFILLGYFNFQIHNYIFDGAHQEFFLRYYALGYISTYFVLACLAYLSYTIKQSHLISLHLQNVIREKEKAELAQLKSQLNPHFLFNTLNTIYSSAESNKEKTPDLILKLSDIFRYIFSEAQQNEIELRKEIKHLKDYIFLQKERLGDKIIIEFLENIDDYDLKIAPLILMTFVENMFKHTSTVRGKHHKLQIHLSLKEGRLVLECINPYFANTDQKNITSGLGIDKTRKRLKLSYPNKYDLKIQQNKGNFKVLLELQLL